MVRVIFWDRILNRFLFAVLYYMAFKNLYAPVISLMFTAISIGKMVEEYTEEEWESLFNE